VDKQVASVFETAQSGACRSGDVHFVEPAVVDPALMADLSRLHTPDKPRIPFTWIVSYDGHRARRNIDYFEHGAEHCRLQYPVRVFRSIVTPAVVVSFVPLGAVRDPHVREWFASYYELPVEEAKHRLDRYPEWPYDGRDSVVVKMEQVNDPHYDPKAVMERSRKQLSELGLDFMRPAKLYS